MSEKQKEILSTIASAVTQMDENQQHELAGIATGMVLAKGTDNEEESHEKSNH